MDVDIALIVLLFVVVVVAAFLYSRERKDKIEAQTKSSTIQQDLASKSAELDALRDSLNDKIAIAVTQAKDESAEALHKKQERIDELKDEKAKVEQESQRLQQGLEYLKSSMQDKIDLEIARVSDEASKSLAEERQRYTQLTNEKAEVERAAKEREDGLRFTIQQRDEEIDRIKNDKARLSVKMLGESLEQHCEIEFNRVRSYAFPRAQFGKDNDASQGTKGDYIYREVDEGGVEVLSIMFEMKNEAEDSVHRKKNTDHFKKLDKDRNDKKCEYAVLVSLLEPESDLYNGGIVDVSHEYPKMFVIRPQFFIPLIGLLRNAAIDTLEVKRELERKRSEDVDLTCFEDKLEELKGAAVKRYGNAQGKCETALKDIELAIKKLQAIQKDMEQIEKESKAACEKTEGLTVKRLTRGNPNMRARIEAAGNTQSAPETSDGSDNKKLHEVTE